MTTISPARDIVTLINVFDVEPENQQALVELLIEATHSVMRHLPGHVSANIHRSLDGRHVANYAQWKRVADFEAMLQNPAAQVHMATATRLASPEPLLYHVVFTDTAQ
jgi:hypothetical protein